MIKFNRGSHSCQYGTHVLPDWCRVVVGWQGGTWADGFIQRYACLRHTRACWRDIDIVLAGRRMARRNAPVRGRDYL